MLVSYRWLEFDEFRKLYVTHLVGEAALDELRTRVKVRFRSEEEIKALAEERAMLRRREKLKEELKARRETNRVIRDRQKSRIVDSHYRDCDGNLRRGKFESGITIKLDKPTFLNGMHETKKPLIGSSMAATRRLRRKLVREKQIHKRREERAAKHNADVSEAATKSRIVLHRQCQIIDMMEEIGFTNVPTTPPEDRILKFLCHDLPHPAFAGRAYAREFSDLMVLSKRKKSPEHPIFCGLVRISLSTPQPLRVLELLSIVQDLERVRDNASAAAWRAFHSPPLCRGIARQRYHVYTAAHDRSEIIHPAIWGSLVASNSTIKDAKLTSPVLGGYSLRQQVSHTRGTPQRAVKIRPPLRRLPRGGGCLDPSIGATSGFDDKIQPCHICLGGQHGCPFCFELPEGLKLHEYSYMPGDTTHELLDDVLCFNLHTDLTTRIALSHDRRVRHDRAEVLIKSVPCGAVVKLAILCDDTVAHLHHLFRATSVHGIEDLAIFYVPTEKGLVEMDVESTVGRDVTDRGNIPLFRYGLNKPGARAVLFHGCHTSMWSMIHVFIRSNLLLENLPYASCFVPHLDGAPRTLPGADLVQSGLWDIFALQVSQHRLHERQDEEAEQLHQRNMERLEMEHRRAAALAARRENSVACGLRTRADRTRLRNVLSSLGVATQRRGGQFTKQKCDLE